MTSQARRPLLHDGAALREPSVNFTRSEFSARNKEHRPSTALLSSDFEAARHYQ